MLLISLVLTTSTWIEADLTSNTENYKLSKNELLLPSLTIFATLFSFPQIFTKQSSFYSAAWQSAYKQSQDRRKTLKCIGLAESLKKQNIINNLKCNTAIFPNITVPIMYRYFAGKLPIKPLGWHKQLTEQMINLSTVRPSFFDYYIDSKGKSQANLTIQGWAFAKKNPRQDIFLVAKYGDGRPVAYLVNLERADVRKVYPLAKEDTGFNLVVPLRNSSSAIQQLLIANKEGSEVIWSQSNKNKR